MTTSTRCGTGKQLTCGPPRSPARHAGGAAARVGRSRRAGGRTPWARLPYGGTAPPSPSTRSGAGSRCCPVSVWTCADHGRRVRPAAFRPAAHLGGRKPCVGLAVPGATTGHPHTARHPRPLSPCEARRPLRSCRSGPIAMSTTGTDEGRVRGTVQTAEAGQVALITGGSSGLGPDDCQRPGPRRLRRRARQPLRRQLRAHRRPPSRRHRTHRARLRLRRQPTSPPLRTSSIVS